jgi:diguanylate cyclase (GGDEF)-like protein
MSTDRAAAAQDRLREIFLRYRGTLAEQLDLVDNAVLAALHGPVHDDVRAAAHRAAHKIAGSAGTFGFRDASHLARQVELALAPEAALGEHEVLHLAQWSVALREALPIKDDAPLPAAAAQPYPDATTAERLLVVVEPDDEARSRVVAEATRRGFSVVERHSPGDARDVLDASEPAAVVLGLLAEDAPWEECRRLVEELAGRAVPALVLAELEEFAERVAWTQLGAYGFLPRGALPREVLDAVERVLDRVPLDDMTVLAVDDDPAVLAAVEQMLRREGLSVVTLDDPARFWTTLEEAAPDLLVLDLDMPGATGYDLCRVVRADSRWAQLPVLFLTASTGPAVTHDVFAAGADDYVAKPVEGPELVVRIANRLERLRLYRRLAETDPLTGVANRRKAIDEVARLLTLAARNRQPLSVALLDLDRFKQVNDTHGHAAGDAVLRELGIRLLDTFRGEDVVARWGGEEFLVAMYGAQAQDARVRLEQVLRHFEQTLFPSTSTTRFSATFSAGLAQYPDDGDDLTQLSAAADGALYQAKTAGRRTVVQAGDAPSPTGVEVDVVLVEDDEGLAPLLLHALDVRGLTSTWLWEGDVAAEQLTGMPPAVRGRVVVLDWDLPGLSGAAVLRRLVDSGTLARTRVIMLTGRSREDEVLQVLELGAADHVAKPFSLPVLLERIRGQLDLSS